MRFEARLRAAVVRYASVAPGSWGLEIHGRGADGEGGSGYTDRRRQPGSVPPSQARDARHLSPGQACRSLPAGSAVASASGREVEVGGHAAQGVVVLGEEVVREAARDVADLVKAG